MRHGCLISDINKAVLGLVRFKKVTMSLVSLDTISKKTVPLEQLYVVFTPTHMLSRQEQEE